jgi:hypothetical protein
LVAVELDGRVGEVGEGHAFSCFVSYCLRHCCLLYQMAPRRSWSRSMDSNNA